jgi:hypothetical protein
MLLTTSVFKVRSGKEATMRVSVEQANQLVRPDIAAVRVAGAVTLLSVTDIETIDHD